MEISGAVLHGLENGTYYTGFDDTVRGMKKRLGTTPKMPKMVVVAERPWLLPLTVVGMVLLVAASLFGGYRFGWENAQVDRSANDALSAELAEARQAIDTLQRQVVDEKLRADVQRDAANVLREDITTSHSEVVALQEEVTFYKNLMAPGELPEGLKVAELELTPAGAAGVFDYDLLLTQVALRRSYISGDLRIDVVGVDGDGLSPVALEGEGGESALERQVLSLTDLTDQTTYPLKFRFRYFQNLTGRMTLPEGFVAQQILVTAKQKGKDAVQTAFPWAESAES